MKTILIVDDELSIVEAIASTLEDEGYHCITAGNGREALEKLQEYRPDLVIADVMMPVMDGREMLQKIRQSQELNHTPVILMSAARGILDSDYGQSAFLAKPFRLDDFMEMVARFAPKDG